MSPSVAVLQPPLLLSRSFIDYPWLCNLAAYQAAAVLRESDLEVSVVDAFDRPGADLYPLPREGQAWLGETRVAFLERLRGLSTDLLVVAGSPFLTGPPGSGWLDELLTVLREGRGAGRVVLADMYVGGMHYLEYDAAGLLRRHPGLDLILRYDGEALLGRLVREMSSVSGRGVWESREAFSLDELPPPAWDLADTEAYFAFLTRVLGSVWRPGPFPPEPARTLPIVTARGCTFGCVFCSRNPGLPGDRRQVRAIPWERVSGWIRDWVGSYRLERLVVLDEVANLDAGRFEAMLSILEALSLRVEFPNGLRADLLTEEHVRRLRGLLSKLKVSLESAVPRVQREVLGKNLDPAAVERVAGWCQVHQVPLQVHVLVGTPGERRGEIVATLHAACRLREVYGAEPLVQFATPLPGTELHRICSEEGFLTGGAEDLHAGFQTRSQLTTPEFDPAFLDQAVSLFRARTNPAGDRKVIVNLSYRCNNRCAFCAVGDRPRRDADLDAVREALTRYRREGFDLLDIDGGEPTLHDGLFEVLEAAGDLGYRRVTVITNGRRLSYAAYARRLARAGVDEVLVSLHASGARLHERLTGSPGSFGQTTAGIRNLLEVLDDPVGLAVNTTLVADNLEDVPALGRLLADWAVRRWNLQVVTPFGRATADQVPAEGDLARVLAGVLGDPPEGLRVQVVNCPPCLLPGFEEAAARDFGKSLRYMVFVGEAGENLQGFLAGRRRQDERCAACVYAVVCPGLYRFEGDEGSA